MNGSKKKKKLKKRCWDFILNITNVLLFSYLSVSSVTVGIIFHAWGSLVALGGLQTNVFEKEAQTTLGTFENRKKFVLDVLEALHLFQLLFILRVYIHISVLYVRQAKIRDLRCDVRASPTEVYCSCEYCRSNFGLL